MINLKNLQRFGSYTVSDKEFIDILEESKQEKTIFCCSKEHLMAVFLLFEGKESY